jgi:glycosyltransferase involved in cell wall biosynthesis
MASQSRPIRLALLIGQMRLGGMEGQVWELFSRLDRSQFEPRLITFAPDLGAVPPEHKSEVTVIPKRRALDLHFYKRLKADLKEFQPDVIFTFLYTANLWGLLAARALRITNIAAYEGGLEMWLGGAKRRIAGWVHRRVRKVVVNSRNSQRFYSARYGLPTAHYPLIYNGVDSDLFHPDPALREKGRAELGFAREDEVVGMIATFKPAKDHRTFLEAARILADQRARAKFLLLGYGPLEGEIRALINALDLADRVVIVHAERVRPEHYAACDITGLSSTEEGFSNVLLEGMAMGIPQVATDVGGNPEAIDNGINGFLVSPRMPDMLAGAWICLLSDGELRRRLGLAARQTAEQRFAINRMVRQTEDFLTSLCKKDLRIEID